VQGEERQTLSKVLERKLPRQVYLQNISSLSPEEVSSGCRDACPSNDVLKKVRQEARSVPTPYHNEWETLAEIREQQQEGCGKSMKGTLQTITMHPRGVALFSEDLIRISHKRAKQDIVYIDATGSVVLGDKRCYAYEIFVRHPVAGKPPLAVASHFTTSHNIPSISYFISSFCHAASLLYRNNKTLPKLVCATAAWLLFNPLFQSFFKENLQSFLDRCVLIASGQYTHSMTELPFLHLCASHFLKNARTIVKEK